MKKILFILLLGVTTLFSNTLIGTWSMDETKTTASLKASSLKANQQLMIKQLFFHSMKSLECSKNHICLINEFYNITPELGKFTWKSDGQNYLLINDKKKLVVKPINASSLKIIISDMIKEKVELYYNKTATK